MKLDESSPTYTYFKLLHILSKTRQVLEATFMILCINTDICQILLMEKKCDCTIV